MNFLSYEYDTTGSRHLHSLTGVFLKQHGIHKEHHLRCFVNRPSYNTNVLLSTAFQSAITNKLLLFLFVVHYIRLFCWTGGSMSPDPFDLSGLCDSLSTTPNSAPKKTPQSFLGENSALVNLENLVTKPTLNSAPVVPVPPPGTIGSRLTT